MTRRVLPELRAAVQRLLTTYGHKPADQAYLARALNSAVLDEALRDQLAFYLNAPDDGFLAPHGPDCTCTDCYRTREVG
jgi:hypothetical protein